MNPGGLWRTGSGEITAGHGRCRTYAAASGGSINPQVLGSSPRGVPRKARATPARAFCVRSQQRSRREDREAEAPHGADRDQQSAPAVAEHGPQRDVVTADAGKIVPVAVGRIRVGPAA